MRHLTLAALTAIGLMAASPLMAQTPAPATGGAMQKAAPAAGKPAEGTVSPPGPAPTPPPKPGSLDFNVFLEQLNNKVELARMQKAGSMLKAERFQLFAEVKDDSLSGIVKSQTSKELVYSCRLAADGAFGCCTQNLRPCGGLRPAPFLFPPRCGSGSGNCTLARIDWGHIYTRCQPRAS